MLSKADKYQQIIQSATNTIILFPHVDNEERKSTVTLQNNIKLPSSYPYRSSYQIENNILKIHQITHQQSKQYPNTISHNQWPKSCIGLVLCEHNQNNQIFYVYGTGALIQSNIVLTSAQNVYCRRLNKQYINIRFIVGISGDKCSGIYDVKRIHYPKEYTIQEYENYNFAVLQFYSDLVHKYGYVGSKTMGNLVEDDKLIEYGYIRDNKEGYFNLRQRKQNKKQKQDLENQTGSGVLIKEYENRYFIVALKHQLFKREYFFVSRKKIRNTINQWTKLTKFNLSQKQIGVQGCNYISKINWTHLNKVYLGNNNIGPQGCKYLSQANWIYLTTIDLTDNNIRAQGCKYLSKTKWTNLEQILLMNNNIDAQGCKHLIQANWTHLTQINLGINNIGNQGCKYLSQANWTDLNTINLGTNKIGAQGCKYLSQAIWANLIWINLGWNNIGTQGCKYLSKVKWRRLSTIYLYDNKIDAQGCKYLSQTNWTQLNKIIFQYNNIGTQGCKYLSQANWAHLKQINLVNNHIKGIVYRLSLLQLYPSKVIKCD